jgi:hypothetical protein
MGIGDLIRNTRPSLGIPTGTLGLITGKRASTARAGRVAGGGEVVYIYDIQWVSRSAHGRRLERDLEVIG